MYNNKRQTVSLNNNNMDEVLFWFYILIVILLALCVLQKSFHHETYTDIVSDQPD